MSSSRWLRFISPAYRYALKAEAEGRYVEAARAYAVVGQSLKVAEMHILEAECQGAPASALRELHVASHFIDEAADSTEGRALLLRLGQIYLRILRRSVLTPAEHEVCIAAAELLQRAGDPRSAGEAYELAGDLSRAAQAYEQAGEIEKVEALHDQLARTRTAQNEEQQLWQRFELHRELGQRREALACIEKLCRIARDPSAAHEQRTALCARLTTPFFVRLRLHQHGREAEILVVGRLPLLFGRGASELHTSAGSVEGSGSPRTPVETTRERSVAFADPGLSRRHAQIDGLQPSESPLRSAIAVNDERSATRFALRDLGSKNGTRLNGLPLASTTAVPLRSRGEISLGQHVSLLYATQSRADILRLTVTRGLSRGLHIWISDQPFVLSVPATDLDPWPESSMLHEGSELAHRNDATGHATAPSVLLQFESDDGQPWLQTSTSPWLNGKPVALRVQLLRGDVVRTADDLRIEVL